MNIKRWILCVCLMIVCVVFLRWLNNIKRYDSDTEESDDSDKESDNEGYEDMLL